MRPGQVYPCCVPNEVLSDSSSGFRQRSGGVLSERGRASCQLTATYPSSRSDVGRQLDTEEAGIGRIRIDLGIHRRCPVHQIGGHLHGDLNVARIRTYRQRLVGREGGWLNIEGCQTDRVVVGADVLDYLNRAGPAMVKPTPSFR